MTFRITFASDERDLLGGLNILELALTQILTNS